MSKNPGKKEFNSILLDMHPLQRILVSVIFSLIIFFIFDLRHKEPVLSITASWDAFAICYIGISWIVFFKRKQADIQKLANKDDGSRLIVLVSIIITSFASMFTVLLLLKAGADSNKLFSLPVAIGGMILSWTMVHTLFTFHYAHLYYQDYEHRTSGGLNFPGDKKPDYVDFAYFSFVIGMTFQVSDVEIDSTTLRRTVLAHSLLAFILNTFVVALTINLVAGFR